MTQPHPNMPNKTRALSLTSRFAPIIRTLKRWRVTSPSMGPANWQQRAFEAYKMITNTHYA